MRKYLENALKYFDYDTNDAAFLLKTYDKIEADPEALSLWNDAVAIYENDFTCDQSEIIKLAARVAAKLRINEYTTDLLIYLCLTGHAKQVYEEHGLSEELFKNTMLDLRYKLEECKAVKGVIGTFVVPWFGGFFDLHRFAFGRLQFEVMPFEKNYEKDDKKLTPQSKVINVHIPRTGTPLSPDLCEAAFAEAESFFANEVDKNVAFVCHSWLLYPENKNILSPHTNTYKFMERFDIIESEDDKDGNDLWRLFDTDERNPDRLPATSSMRNAYISHLKNGGRVGSGYGVFFAKH